MAQRATTDHESLPRPFIVIPAFFQPESRKTAWIPAKNMPV
jgi:hypothetical protein